MKYTSLFQDVLFTVLELSFLGLIIVYLSKSYLSVITNPYIQDMTRNWESQAISSVFAVASSMNSIANSNNSTCTQLFTNNWSGIVSTCKCNSQVFKGECSLFEILLFDCETIPSIPPKETQLWKGSSICVRSSPFNYFDSITLLPTESKCPDNYMICGVDTKNFPLCFPNSYPCPIGDIKISYRLNSDNNNTENIKLNNDWYLNYNTGNNTNRLAINVRYSEGKVCTNPNESNWKNYFKYTDVTSNTNGNCSFFHDWYNYDERYVQLDTQSKFKYFWENGIYARIEVLPQIEENDLISTNADLYSRSYIHWSPSCRNEPRLKPETVINDWNEFAKLEVLLDYYRVFSYFVLGSLSVILVYKLYLRFNESIHWVNWTKISWALLSGFLGSNLVLICLCSRNVDAASKLMHQHCGDFITNTSLLNVGENVFGSLSVLYSTLFFALILLVLLYIKMKLQP